MRFEGTQNYVATEDLKVAVNAAVTLRRPLLVKGEPGTGKTVLAHEIARAVGAPLIEWNVKIDHQGPIRVSTNMTRGAASRRQLGDPRVQRESPTTSAAASCGRRSPRPQLPSS
jgi:hypothetical protein